MFWGDLAYPVLFDILRYPAGDTPAPNEPKLGVQKSASRPRKQHFNPESTNAPAPNEATDAAKCGVLSDVNTTSTPTKKRANARAKRSELAAPPPKPRPGLAAVPHSFTMWNRTPPNALGHSDGRASLRVAAKRTGRGLVFSSFLASSDTRPSVCTGQLSVEPGQPAGYGADFLVGDGAAFDSRDGHHFHNGIGQEDLVGVE